MIHGYTNTRRVARYMYMYMYAKTCIHIYTPVHVHVYQVHMYMYTYVIAGHTIRIAPHFHNLEISSFPNSRKKRQMLLKNISPFQWLFVTSIQVYCTRICMVELLRRWQMSTHTRLCVRGYHVPCLSVDLDSICRRSTWSDCSWWNFGATCTCMQYLEMFMWNLIFSIAII